MNGRRGESERQLQDDWRHQADDARSLMFQGSRRVVVEVLARDDRHLQQEFSYGDRDDQKSRLGPGTREAAPA